MDDGSVATQARAQLRDVLHADGPDASLGDQAPFHHIRSTIVRT